MILALARTSELPVPRVLATAYVELVRESIARLQVMIEPALTDSNDALRVVGAMAVGVGSTLWRWIGSIGAISSN